MAAGVTLSGSLAQLAEHVAVNHRVGSSSLPRIVFLYCRGVIGSTIVSKTISQGSSPCGRASLWDSSIAEQPALTR